MGLILSVLWVVGQEQIVLGCNCVVVCRSGTECGRWNRAVDCRPGMN
jgi:hypothetical protein